jgi:hypothetical protein
MIAKEMGKRVAQGSLESLKALKEPVTTPA